jgi:hypothetical protein
MRGSRSPYCSKYRRCNFSATSRIYQRCRSLHCPPALQPANEASPLAFTRTGPCIFPALRAQEGWALGQWNPLALVGHLPPAPPPPVGFPPLPQEPVGTPPAPAPALCCERSLYTMCIHQEVWILRHLSLILMNSKTCVVHGHFSLFRFLVFLKGCKRVCMRDIFMR